jgi:hypothetical protein
MSAIAISAPRWSLARFFRSLLAFLVSLLLLASAAIEAGRRVQSSEQGHDDRLVRLALERDQA